MGVDIIVYCEKRNMTNEWEVCTPSCLNKRTSFHIPRVPATFQVLSRLYEDKYGADFKSISNNRGLPLDVSNEVKHLLIDENGEIYGHSYVTLQEMLNFEWDTESEQYDRYREIVAEELFEIIDFMRLSITGGLTNNDIRLVFGYSC